MSGQGYGWPLYADSMKPRHTQRQAHGMILYDSNQVLYCSPNTNIFYVARGRRRSILLTHGWDVLTLQDAER